MCYGAYWRIGSLGSWKRVRHREKLTDAVQSNNGGRRRKIFQWKILYDKKSKTERLLSDL